MGILLDFLPLIVKLLDKTLGGKTGPTKMATGVSLVQRLLQALMDTKQQQTAAPPDEITKALQGVVDELNKKGVLKGKDTVLDHQHSDLGKRFAAIAAQVIVEYTR